MRGENYTIFFPYAPPNDASVCELTKARGKVFISEISKQAQQTELK